MTNAPLRQSAGRSTGTTPKQDVVPPIVPAATDNDHETRCERCKRVLRSELAIRAGIGSTCALLALGGEGR